jgi:HK97 family phage prohead protease
MIRKEFISNIKAVEPEARVWSAMVSTEDVDRQGEIVRATRAGIKLDSFLKNPVVLWAHHYDEPPIAKALSMEILEGKGIRSTFQFPAPGISTRATEIMKLVEAGFLRAVSIGFIPLESRPLTRDDWGPKEYTSIELLEFSICDIPSNPSAVISQSLNTLQNGLKKGKPVTSADVDQALYEYLDQLLTMISLQVGGNLSQKNPRRQQPGRG